MLRWIPYAFIRISFFFILGILSAIYWGQYLSNEHAIWVIGSSILLFIISKLFLVKNRFYSYSWVQGLLAFVAIFFIGYLNLNFHNDALRQDHLLHFTQVTAYSGVVESPPEEKENTYKYDLTIDHVQSDSSWKKAYAQIYIYVDKEQPMLAYGDRIMVQGSPSVISPPMNPGEFNYKRFLTFNNIYHQDYLKENFVKVGHETPSLILEKAYQLRAEASQILAENIATDRENDIAQALVLGVKDGLDRDIKFAYSASGAMHVLAVSGLHVGIIYALVLLLFKPFRKTLIVNWLTAVVSLLVLWSYAMITGFSPSVLRAVTMFSFVAVALAAKRNTNIYNTLAASGCILLLFNPYLIMSVGFQLSFLAVFGIVFIQPRLYNFIEVDNYWLDKIWAITAVSIAAQIATIPLTLLYFHQFPTFFLVSNLAVIPGAFAILCLGLLLLAVSPFPVLAQAVGWLMQKVIWLVNYVVFQISDIPYSQITDIEINTWQAWLIIGVVVSFVLLFKYKRFHYLSLAFIMVCAFSITEIIQTLDAKDQKKITLYRVNKHTAIDFTKGLHSRLFTDSLFKADSEGVRFHIRPNRLYSGIIDHDFASLNDPVFNSKDGFTAINWEHTDLLILKGNGQKFELKQPVQVDYLILAEDFDQNIEWVTQNFSYKKLILDGSLKWYIADNLKEEAQEKGVNYYSIYHQGAFEININQL